MKNHFILTKDGVDISDVDEASIVYQIEENKIIPISVAEIGAAMSKLDNNKVPMVMQKVYWIKSAAEVELGIHITQVHPIVAQFAVQMNQELIANLDKGPWENWDNVPKIQDELSYHLEKLARSMQNLDKNGIREHLADCGNFLMMLGNAYNTYEKP